jgi:hypothetical protein
MITIEHEVSGHMSHTVTNKMTKQLEWKINRKKVCEACCNGKA